MQFTFWYNVTQFIRIMESIKQFAVFNSVRDIEPIFIQNWYPSKTFKGAFTVFYIFPNSKGRALTIQASLYFLSRFYFLSFRRYKINFQEKIASPLKKLGCVYGLYFIFPDLWGWARFHFKNYFKKVFMERL